MLRDKDIRIALIEEINNLNNGNNYRIVEELAVCDGEARVDVALINGKLCGYEIKSDRDTLDRLPGQINAYNTTFDKVTIVVGEKFEKSIIYEVPEWWGIGIAHINRHGDIGIYNMRPAIYNEDVQAKSVLELLWKDEILALLKSKGIKGLSNKNRRKLRDIAIKAIPLNEIKDYTRETLKTRQGWRVD